MYALFKFGPTLKNKTVKNDMQARIKYVNSKGVVRIIFSKALMPIANVSIIETQEVLKFQIKNPQARAD